MHKIDEKLADVTARIHQAAKNAQRDSADITLLAVSKTRPPAAIREAYNAGLRCFGENYLQEALDKQAALDDLTDIQWHFIGPIQSNKTRAIAESFQWVHSIDRLKIALRLSQQRPTDLPALNICLQVNIGGEASKSGVAPDTLTALAQAVDALPQLCLRGLMAIPAPSDDPAQQARAFAALAQALQQLRELGLNGPLDTLSMGMSADMEAAIGEGSTCVRIGTDIFGARATKSETHNPGNAQ